MNQYKQDTEKQSTETQEKGASEDMSDVNLNVRSVEQPDCVSEIE